eukprot:jgi/Chrzof1/5567/Cz16g07240.t1
MDPAQAARLQHNESVKQCGRAAEVVRAVFLSQHPDKLRPFITPAVEASITARASTAPPHLKLPDPVTQQPECIKAVMREYQVEGLQWLVSQFD